MEQNQADLPAEKITPCLEFEFYQLIQEIIGKNTFVYFDLPVDEELSKHMIYIKDGYVKKYGLDYFKMYYTDILKLARIVLTDIHLTVRNQRSFAEDVIMYDNYWNKLRNPDDSALLAPAKIVRVRGGLPIELKVELKAYQQAVLYSMMSIERKRQIYDVTDKKERKLIIDAADLSMQMGSGKTIVILALVCQRADSNSPTDGFRPEDKIDTTVPTGIWFPAEDAAVLCVSKNYLKCNLIFTNKNSFDQWKTEILTKTSGLNVIYINDVASLRTFINKIDDIFNADIVLIKNNSVVANTYAPWETDRQTSGNRHLMNAIGSIFKGFIFNRVIIDDFDITPIKSSDGGIRANFYWYVSATMLKHRASKENAFSLLPYPKNATHWIFENLAICPTREFIEKCNVLPGIKIYKKLFAAQNAGMMRVISGAAANDPMLADIVEMINGDSVDEAAKRLGIAENSASAIFKKILDRSYKPYMHALKMLNDVKRLKAIHFNEQQDLPEEMIKTINKEIREAELVTIPPFRDYALNRMIKNIEESATNQRNKEGAAIDKLRQSQTECQICNLTLYNPDEPMHESIKGAITIPCCANMFCSTCAIVGSKFVNVNGELTGMCPTCFKVIKKSDLIFISIKNNLGWDILNDDALLSNSASQAGPSSAPAGAVVGQAEPVEGEKFSLKLYALLDIVAGKLPENSVAFDHKFIGVMSGDQKVPDVDRNPADVKILVFCKYHTTKEQVKRFLNLNKIKYVVLEGSSEDKQLQIRYMKEHDVPIMLLMTSSDCASLNIQYMTDCVFIHKMISKEIESQAVGRCQRIGRDPNLPLRVHYLLYHHEDGQVEAQANRGGNGNLAVPVNIV